MVECPSCGKVKGEMRKRIKQITQSQTKEDKVFVCEKCGQSLGDPKEEVEKDSL